MRLYGKNPVIERLKVNPKTIKKIYLQFGHDDAGYILKKAKQWGIPAYQVPRSKLQKLARSLNSQGIVTEVEGFDYTSYEDLLEFCLKKKHELIFLDGLKDPQNLGGIIRALACLGNFSIILPTHDSVEVTESVLRVACGGDNYVKIAKVSNLSQAIVKAKDAGFWIAGAVVSGGKPLGKVDMPFPLGLVIGSEQKGIRMAICKQLDTEITIPMVQPRLSMNVAHATTIFCYEIMRQRVNYREKKKK